MNAGPENADDAAVVLFDGVCVLCARSVRFIARRDPAVRFRFAAHGSPAAQRLIGTCGPAVGADAIVLVTAGGCLSGADAVLAIARGLAPPWPLLARVAGIVPRGVLQAAYRLVARRRYRWFGRRDACFVPPHNIRERFLEEGITC